MSLVDPIVVCDAVLETVMQQEVVLANRTDFAADVMGGAGTAQNPFSAGGASNVTDPPFDRIMRTLAAVGNRHGAVAAWRLLHARVSNEREPGVAAF
jgi:hypothetical protein